MPERAGQKPYTAKNAENDTILGDAFGTALVGGADMMIVQATGGHPQLDNDPTPILDPSHPLMQVLLSERDFYECYMIAAFTHLGLEGIDRLQSKLTKRRIPLKVKLGAAVAASIGLLVPAETSLGQGYLGTPDLKDIPAGVAGVIAYPLVDSLFRRHYNKKITTVPNTVHLK